MGQRPWIKIGGIAAVAIGVIVGGLAAYHTRPSEAMVTLYKTPECGCCDEWAEHMRQNGFVVQVQTRPDVTPVKRRLGVPEDLESCHTAEVAGYVIEGHVPAADVRALLRKRVQTRGLAVAGMPLGSPGMDSGARSEPYEVISFTGGGRAVFSRY